MFEYDSVNEVLYTLIGKIKAVYIKSCDAIKEGININKLTICHRVSLSSCVEVPHRDGGVCGY